LVRALACHARGRGFKSRHSRHFLFPNLPNGAKEPKPGWRHRAAPFKYIAYIALRRVFDRRDGFRLPLPGFGGNWPMSGPIRTRSAPAHGKVLKTRRLARA
jgi:hypothetical protein